MILSIDTTEKGTLKLVLRDGETAAEKTIKTDRLSEDLLPALEKFLKKHKVRLAEIEKVQVNPGPGSFSAIRSGVAVANALNFALGNKVEIVLPIYDKVPNISRPKKH